MDTNTRNGKDFVYLYGILGENNNPANFKMTRRQVFAQNKGYEDSGIRKVARRKCD